MGRILKGSVLKRLPFAALDFAAAGENQGALQSGALAGLRRLAVVGNAGVDRAQEGFVGGWIVDSSGHGTAVLDEPDRDAELGNSFDELASAVERIDHPNPRALQADGIVHALFRKPAFSVAQQFLAQNGVESAIGFGDGIVPDLVFGFNRSGREAGEDRARGFQRGMNAFQYLCVGF